MLAHHVADAAFAGSLDQRGDMVTSQHAQWVPCTFQTHYLYLFEVSVSTKPIQSLFHKGTQTYDTQIHVSILIIRNIRSQLLFLKFLNKPINTLHQSLTSSSIIQLNPIKTHGKQYLNSYLKVTA